MWIGVVSLFPEMFKAVTDYGISRRAVENGLLTLEVWNPREFAEDKHRTVDDKPYGGGPGMLMKVQPLKDAINAAKSKAQAQCPVIYLSPQGKPLEQADLASLALLPEVILVAGRYEGIDERLIESAIDMEVSIGDFVASGGELPAMLLIDGVTRLLPGAVGDADSVEQDSFSNGLLDYPQYTRPETEDGLTVPEVLMSGDHGQIARWRKMQSLGRTYIKRPDLITARTLTEEEKQLLDEYLAKRET
jgi:tRNA (guanine37-N1)-methyltransferase